MASTSDAGVLDLYGFCLPGLTNQDRAARERCQKYADGRATKWAKFEKSKQLPGGTSLKRYVRKARHAQMAHHCWLAGWLADRPGASSDRRCVPISLTCLRQGAPPQPTVARLCTLFWWDEQVSLATCAAAAPPSPPPSRLHSAVSHAPQRARRRPQGVPHHLRSWVWWQLSGARPKQAAAGPGYFARMATLGQNQPSSNQVELVSAAVAPFAHLAAGTVAS